MERLHVLIPLIRSLFFILLRKGKEGLEPLHGLNPFNQVIGFYKGDFYYKDIQCNPVLIPLIRSLVFIRFYRQGGFPCLERLNPFNQVIVFYETVKADYWVNRQGS